MRETTHRQYQGWLQYLDEEWNTPTRSDHYLMQIAAEVRRVLAKRPRTIRLKDFFLKFTKAKKQEGIEEAEESLPEENVYHDMHDRLPNRDAQRKRKQKAIAARAKSSWLSRFPPGMVKRRRKLPDGTIVDMPQKGRQSHKTRLS